jgi:hypothetical protein
MASPTNPRATEKLVQNPRAGLLPPKAANMSGAMTTPRYAITENTARTASVTGADLPAETYPPQKRAR